jgi:predicted nucleic acid-binding protein
MRMKILDSTVIIDFLRGQSRAIEIVEKNKDDIATTTISQFEVLFGIFKQQKLSQQELLSGRRFFDMIDSLPLDKLSASLAAEIAGALLKQGKTIGHNDCLIAAIALRNRVDAIITENRKDFQKIKGIQVETY